MTQLMAPMGRELRLDGPNEQLSPQQRADLDISDKSVQQIQSTATRLLQSSPGFAEKLANPKTAPRSGSGKSDDRDVMIAVLLALLH
eukprot:Skav208465  [mRNA]  locus=scaffold1104:239796:241006:+ [translate_table: standard]